MKTPFIISSVLLVLGLISFAHGDATIDDVGGYIASFPGPVKHDTDYTNEATGRVEIFETICALTTEDYMVSYAESPAFSAPDQTKVYEGAIQRMLIQDKATLRSQAWCKLGNVTGVEYIADVTNSTLVVHARMFLVGTRMYQVIYAGTIGTERTKTTTDFLDSFRVLR